MAQSEVGSKLNVENDSALSQSDDAFVAQCREAWSVNESRDLKARHDLGKLLNDRLGKPGKRQTYGAKVVELVAKELKVSRSELSRMRQFADRYPSFEEFSKRKSSCTNWTKVKEVLVKSDRKTSKTREKPVTTPVERLMRRIRGVCNEIENEATFREAAASPEIRNQLQALVKAADRYLHPEPQLS